MGKTRDLFKKIRDTKETFHAQMGTIKDRNGMGLTEVEDISGDPGRAGSCSKSHISQGFRPGHVLNTTGQAPSGS